MGCLYSLSLLSVLFACSMVAAQYRWYDLPSKWDSHPYQNNNRRLYKCGESNPQYDCIFYDVSIDRDTRGVRFGHDGLTKNNQKNVTFKNSFIKKLPETLLDSFEQIELLDLTSLQIEEIEPFALTNGYIRELYMGSNVIRELPIFAFRNMRFLNVLVLDWNNISRLPEGIFFGTPALVALSIANNNLERLDDNTFKKSKALKFLKMSNNKLTHLDLSLIPSLIHGNVSSNLLTTLAIPKEMIKLDASNNRLNTVRGLDNEVLAILRLQHNNLTNTAWLLHYSGLVDVNLSHNSLEKITYHHFAHMYRLERLYLSNNRLRALNLGPSPIRTLQIFDVRHNQLRYVENYQRQFDTLDQLFLDHNSIVTLKLSFKNRLNALTLSHNDWDCNSLVQLLYNLSVPVIEDSDRNCRMDYQLMENFCCKENELDRLLKNIRQASVAEKIQRLEGRCSAVDVITSLQNMVNYVSQLGGASALQSNLQLLNEINQLESEIRGIKHQQSQFEQNVKSLHSEIDNNMRRYRVIKEGLVRPSENLRKVFEYLKIRNTLEQMITKNRHSEVERAQQKAEALEQEELALHIRLTENRNKESEIQREILLKIRKVKWFEYICRRRNLCEQSTANYNI